MHRPSVVASLIFLASIAACEKRGPKLLLQGDQPAPVLRTEGYPNEVFTVVSVVPYGHQKSMSLVVAEDGTSLRERSAFVAASVLGLRPGAIVRVHKMCYRAGEHSGTDRSSASYLTDVCTDIVEPYALPNAESPAPAPEPAVPANREPAAGSGGDAKAP
jgi:hypothetical protein